MSALLTLFNLVLAFGNFLGAYENWEAGKSVALFQAACGGFILALAFVMAHGEVKAR